MPATTVPQMLKKFLLVVLFAAVAAGGIWLAMHGSSVRTSSAAVGALLPKDTLALVYVPDVNRARAEFRETDIYKLWREPAIQDFLRQPLTKLPQKNAFSEQLAAIEPLEMKDAFFAVTSWENKQSKVLAGFRFKGSEEKAEKIINQWRERMHVTAPPAEHQTVDYETHRIEVTSEGELTIATVYDGDWFFAANDLGALKAVLDRADGRTKDSATTLGADENFIAASKHLPPVYAARAYARVDRYFESLTSSLPNSDNNDERFTLLRQIRNFSAATTFENGKIRDTLFVGMPKRDEEGELTRASLSLATRDAILYAAGFLHLPKQLPESPGAALPGFPAVTQRVVTALSASGVTIESWKAAFGTEFGIIGEWSANARIPMFFATVPVKDFTKAGELLGKITSAMSDEDQAWTKTEKDGVQYLSQAPTNPFLSIAVTVALSNDRLVVGHDLAGVESVVKRNASRGSELASSDPFKTAERLLPPGKDLFVYFDTALTYARLDSALRPMLIMAAAFMPSIGDSVDLGKLPEPGVVTKHLSPIVMTQRYENDGYVTESIGPISMFQAGVAAIAATGAGATFYKDKLPNFGGTAAPSASSPQRHIPVPSPSPTESPDE
jgi:hypothetical protein